MVVTRIVMPRQKHTSYVVIQQFAANMKYLHKHSLTLTTTTRAVWLNQRTEPKKPTREKKVKQLNHHRGIRGIIKTVGKRKL